MISKVFAISDSLLVKFIEKGDDRNTYILLNVQDHKKNERLTNLFNIEFVIFEKYYKNQYKNFYGFLFDVIINKKVIPRKFINGIVSTPVKNTRIYRDSKRGEKYIVAKYLKKEKNRYIQSKKLPESQQNDLIRVMLQYKFCVIVEDLRGELYFFKL